MKRIHIHLTVGDLEKNIQFYTSLFNSKPSVLKDDYAKWMLDDPRVNFAISNRSTKIGLDHLGIQAENDTELAELKQQIEQADAPLNSQSGTSCCYARSDKHWTLDPQGIAWENFHTLGQVPTFNDSGTQTTPAKAACCAPTLKTAGGCC